MTKELYAGDVKVMDFDASEKATQKRINFFGKQGRVGRRQVEEEEEDGGKAYKARRRNTNER
jgi:hypothetical protein